jgi:hypothetical protein
MDSVCFALFWSWFFGVLEASWTWIGISFSRFGKIFAIILLNIFYIPLAWTPFPSSMSMIHRFGLLIESQSSCIYLLQLLSLLPKILLFFLYIYFVFEHWNSVFLLFQSAGVAFTYVFSWFMVLFISRISVWFFSWDFSYLCYTSLSYLMLSSLFYICLFFIVSLVSCWGLLKSSLSSFHCFISL